MGDKRTCRCYQLFCKCHIGTCIKLFCKRSCVYAYTYGNMSLLCCLNNRIHTLPRANISGIDAERRGTEMRCLDGKPMIKVNIGNNRKRAFLTYLFKSRKSVCVRNGHTDYLASCVCKCFDLRKCRGGVRCFGGTHGLHGYRSATSHLHRPHHHRMCFFTGKLSHTSTSYPNSKRKMSFLSATTKMNKKNARPI